MSGKSDVFKQQLNDQQTTAALVWLFAIITTVVLASPGSVAQMPDTDDVTNVTPSSPFTLQLHPPPGPGLTDQASTPQRLLSNLEYPTDAAHLSVKELQPRRLRAGSTGEFILHGKGFTSHTDVELAKPNPYVAISDVRFVDSDTLKVTIAASKETRTGVFNFTVQDPRSGRDKLAPGLIVVHVPPAR